MPTYTHAIQILETWKVGGESWAADPNHAGTVESNGTAHQHARRVLNHYLADVAADMELPVGAPGAEPASPVRAVVWDGASQGTLFTAAAILHAWHDTGGMVGRIVTRLDDDSPCPVTGRVVYRVDDEWVEVAWGAEHDKTNPRTDREAVDELTPFARGGRR
jgi:hypothetical protein